MAIVRCPNCSRNFSVGNAPVSVKCPHCFSIVNLSSEYNQTNNSFIGKILEKPSSSFLFGVGTSLALAGAAYLANKVLNATEDASKIINYFQSQGHKHVPKAILYRSEGYPTFPEQPQYVFKHGIFSKKLVTRLIASLDGEYERELERITDWQELGKLYKKAYEIKIKKPQYFEDTYKHLLHEIAIAISHSDSDLIDVLTKLHVGYNKWDSYLISTGDFKISKTYQGNTYKFSPVWLINPPLTFRANQKLGSTRWAVLLWISPEDYNIEIVR